MNFYETFQKNHIFTYGLPFFSSNFWSSVNIKIFKEKKKNFFLKKDLVFFSKIFNKFASKNIGIKKMYIYRVVTSFEKMKLKNKFHLLVL